MSDTAPIDDLATWIQAYQEANRHITQWTETAARIKQHITTALDTANATVGTVNGRPAVKWTPVVTRRLDTKRLKAEHPEVAETYTTETVSRRFTVIDQPEQT